MRVAALAFCVTVAVAHAMTSDMLACGDKYLVLGRGTRFERGAHARTAASILLYADPSSAVGRAFADLGVGSVLQRAGYHATSVNTATDLDRVLRDTKFDVILVDVGQAADLEQRIGAAPHAPILVPTVYNPSGNELKQLRQRYQCVLKSPAGRESLLDTVDEAVALRMKKQSGLAAQRH
jgi:Response regulator containing CheY-like receiver, AAA-type ATPase, and DNA-binding domains